MMDDRMKDALEQIARRDVPENVNIWPNVQALLRKDAGPMKPQFKLSWSLVLLILALILATTVAYALYRYFSDPGLQSVNEAGLITNLNMTGQPTILPPATPSGEREGPATFVGSEKTLENVAVTLDWIYLDETRLAFGFSARGLGPDEAFNIPSVTFAGVTPVQPRGGNFSSGVSGDMTTGEYVSYQVINADVIGRDRIDMGIDIPLVHFDPMAANPAGGPMIASFHFDVKDVPLYRGQTLYFQQTYSSRVNGVEMRLENVTVSPSYTNARLCYDLPSTDKDWIIEYAAVKFGDPHDVQFAADATSEVRSQSYTLIGDENGVRCAEVGIPLGNSSLASNAAEPMLKLTVRELTVPLSGEALPAERILAANQELAQYGVEIAPAAPGEESGPGGWKYVRCDRCTERDYSLQVMEALEESRPGPWEFYVDLPRKDAIPGLVPPTPTPLASESAGDTTVVLEKAYADANRAVFIVHFAGPQASYGISNASLRDSEGHEINAGLGIGSPEDTPTTIQLEFLPAGELKAERFKGQLVLNFSAGPQTLEVRFDLDLPVYQPLVVEPKQVVTANGVEMLMQMAKVTPSFTTAYLCYNKPTPADWMVGQQAALQIGSDQAQASTYSLLFDSDYGDMGKGPEPGWKSPVETGRCVKVGFPVGHHNRAETLTLTIPELQQSMPEVIPDAEVKAALAKLKAQGIEMDYVTFTAGGGGGGGPVYKKLPAGMTEEQAYRSFIEALGYVYKGPWVFTVDITP